MRRGRGCAGGGEAGGDEQVLFRSGFHGRRCRYGAEGSHGRRAFSWPAARSLPPCAPALQPPPPPAARGRLGGSVGALSRPPLSLCPPPPPQERGGAQAPRVQPRARVVERFRSRAPLRGLPLSCGASRVQVPGGAAAAGTRLQRGSLGRAARCPGAGGTDSPSGLAGVPPLRGTERVQPVDAW